MMKAISIARAPGVSMPLGVLVGVVALLLSGCLDRVHSDANKPSGIDLSAIDKSVRLQDDFYNYANGTWIKNTPIPGDKTRWGAFDMLREKSQKDVHVIIDEVAAAPEGEDAQKIADLYNSFMNESAVESAGLQPLDEEFAQIAKLNSHQAVLEHFATAFRRGYDAPFNAWVNADPKNPDVYILQFYQSGIGLGDRDYYLDKSEKGLDTLNKYKAYIANLLKQSGDKKAVAHAQAIVKAETALAAVQWTKEDNRDDEKTYNKFTQAELKLLMPHFPWSAYFARLGIPEQESVLVYEPSYFNALTDVIAQQSLETWKAYFRFQLLDSYADYLNKSIVDAKFDFRQRQLTGQSELAPRWKRGVDTLNMSVGELLGKIYVERYFPPEAKARMVHLVNNLKLAYAESIQSLDWMSPETKKAALVKLAGFTTKIGYPDKWRDYSALHLEPNKLVANMMAVQTFDVNFMFNKLGKPMNRSEWGMSPQTVNAYYNPVMNEIVFPAAILQPPFFDMQADDAVNYGSIGAVIGHEIGHGFDDQGAKYDGEGRLRDWWTKEDLEKFQARTKALIAQYNKFEPLPGQFVNGQFTLGENIGDLGGMSIALKAYKIALAGKKGPTIDGLSGEQRVFFGWAQVWRSKAKDEMTIRLLKMDPHSPAIYRVNGIVRNIDAFYEAFGVKPGDAMYLPPKDRVKIW